MKALTMIKMKNEFLEQYSNDIAYIKIQFFTNKMGEKYIHYNKFFKKNVVNQSRDINKIGRNHEPQSEMRIRSKFNDFDLFIKMLKKLLNIEKSYFVMNAGTTFSEKFIEQTNEEITKKEDTPKIYSTSKGDKIIEKQNFKIKPKHIIIFILLIGLLYSKPLVIRLFPSLASSDILSTTIILIPMLIILYGTWFFNKIK